MCQDDTEGGLFSSRCNRGATELRLPHQAQYQSGTLSERELCCSSVAALLQICCSSVTPRLRGGLELRLPHRLTDGISIEYIAGLGALYLPVHPFYRIFTHSLIQPAVGARLAFISPLIHLPVYNFTSSNVPVKCAPICSSLSNHCAFYKFTNLLSILLLLTLSNVIPHLRDTNVELIQSNVSNLIQAI